MNRSLEGFRDYLCLIPVGRIMGFFLCLGCLSCDEMPLRINFVLPNEFRGIFRIIVDGSKGEEVALKDEAYTYEILKDRVLVIKDDTPFRRYYRIHARYENGDGIPLAYTKNMFPAGTLIIYGPYEDVDDAAHKVFWFFLGTEEEIRSIQKTTRNIKSG